MRQTVAYFLLGFAVLWCSVGDARCEEPKAPEAAAPAEEPKPPAKPDPSGADTGNIGVLGIEKPALKEIDPDKPEVKDVANNITALYKFVETLGDVAGKNRVGINMMWTLLTGFLVMFMQAGFALVETGLTRYKNVAHTMAMNFMVYALGMLGFYICGFALMFGGFGAVGTMGGGELLTSEYTVKVMDKDFGIFGYEGFFLTGKAFDVSILALFLFQMVFMDTTATIPTGAMAERWKFLPFVIFGFFVSMVIYPIYGNWVWGGGWLAKLGANFGIGHGHVDFAGSSVVHMVGGVTALAGALIIGARIGKFNKDGSVNVLPAHSVPMYMLGTFILAFGWFGFNPGSSLAGTDLIIARCAVNTMLASAGGALASMVYMWLVYGKPDPSFMCNGMLAGLVAITAPCAFITPTASVIVGLIAGVLVVWSCLFWEKVVKVDDPVGAISVHGVNGAWGIISLGLFADGTYGQGWNGSFWYKLADGKLQWYAEKLKELPPGVTEQGVTGFFYGNPSQLYAELIGIGANIAWVFPVAFVFFWIVEKTIGNRVSAEVELAGLDVPEMGVFGYINEDPKSPEGHVLHAGAEPRSAAAPPNGKPKFTVVVEGIPQGALLKVWSDLCQPTDKPPSPDFLEIYPYMTTCKGNRFTFRGGASDKVETSLKKLLTSLSGQQLTTRVER